MLYSVSAGPGNVPGDLEALSAGVTVPCRWSASDRSMVPLGCLSLGNREEAQEGRGGRQQDRHHQLARRQEIPCAYSSAKHAVE